MTTEGVIGRVLTASRDASRVDPGRRLCGWCDREIPARARRDARYCGVRCRQAAHRFGAGARRVSATISPLRLAYADPPYPGKAHLYRDHPDFAGEVDHRRLVEQLVDGFPDGWALSTSATALPMVLGFCPDTVRVAAWVRGSRHGRSALPLSSWEPVVVHRGRAEVSLGPGLRLDSLVHHVHPRLTDPRRVIGAKPATFIYWMFDLLGAMPGDDLVDLFPGSGGVSRAWDIYSSRQYSDDASCPPAEPTDPSPVTMAIPDASLSIDTRRVDPSCPPGALA